MEIDLHVRLFATTLIHSGGQTSPTQGPDGTKFIATANFTVYNQTGTGMTRVWLYPAGHVQDADQSDFLEVRQWCALLDLSHLCRVCGCGCGGAWSVSCRRVCRCVCCRTC